MSVVRKRRRQNACRMQDSLHRAAFCVGFVIGGERSPSRRWSWRTFRCGCRDAARVRAVCWSRLHARSGRSSFRFRSLSSRPHLLRDSLVRRVVRVCEGAVRSPHQTPRPWSVAKHDFATARPPLPRKPSAPERAMGSAAHRSGWMLDALQLDDRHILLLGNRGLPTLVGVPPSGTHAERGLPRAAGGARVAEGL